MVSYNLYIFVVLFLYVRRILVGGGGGETTKTIRRKYAHYTQP